jgi:hypothetical protein
MEIIFVFVILMFGGITYSTAKAKGYKLGIAHANDAADKAFEEVAGDMSLEMFKLNHELKLYKMMLAAYVDKFGDDLALDEINREIEEYKNEV